MVSMLEFKYASSLSALKRIECDFRAICHSQQRVGSVQIVFCRLHESHCIYIFVTIVTFKATFDNTYYNISILHAVYIYKHILESG